MNKIQDQRDREMGITRDTPKYTFESWFDESQRFGVVVAPDPLPLINWKHFNTKHSNVKVLNRNLAKHRLFFCEGCQQTFLDRDHSDPFNLHDNPLYHPRR
jgi:hypothetical protein